MSISTIILAAGQGKRLLPLTKETPKCLLLIGDLPILHLQLEALKKNDLKNITIVIGFEKEKVKKYIENNFAKLKVNFVFNPLFESTNTLYSLALATPHIPKNTTVIQLNGDVVFDGAILELLLSTDSLKSHIATKYTKCGAEEMKILLNKNGSVATINKKIHPVRALGEAIGINKFTPNFWNIFSENLQNLKDNFSNEYFEFALEHVLVNSDVRLWPLDVGERYAIEIDYAEDLKIARQISKHHA